MNFFNIKLHKSSVFKDEKKADEGGVLIEEEPSDQESNEPTDTVNKMASEIPEIPKENTQNSPPRTEEEPENPKANEESAKESPPKKQVPKNIVTSWSDWVAKTTTSTVNKETNSASQPQLKRLAELPFCAKSKAYNKLTR